MCSEDGVSNSSHINGTSIASLRESGQDRKLKSYASPSKPVAKTLLFRARD